MLLRQFRLIFAHALPMLMTQLASLGMMLIDTSLLGHYGTEDLAAVAVGGGIYIAIAFGLTGITQAVAPMVAQHVGAERKQAIAACLQQGFWLALLLALPGLLLLRHPEPLFALSEMAPGIEDKARAYLALLAWGMPATLLYRTFYACCNALGHPRPLMLISFAATLLHGGLAWTLVNGGWGNIAPGVFGCGLSNAITAWFTVVAGLIYLRRSRVLAGYRLLAAWQKPDLKSLSALFRLGLPMGFSNFVEISSFTLVALFVAELGATVLAGHRIIANLAALCYMLPLALAIATLTQLGQAVGARDELRARCSLWAGLLLGGGLSALLGLLVWLNAASIIALGSNDDAVARVALPLLAYLALYQLADGIQVVAVHALRAYKITFAPMLIHLACFWGVGLWGGWWLAFHPLDLLFGQINSPALGVAGFWLAAAISIALAAILLSVLLWRVLLSLREAETPASADKTALEQSF